VSGASIRAGRFAPVLAFAVHILTASGAAFALLALVAAARADWQQMFLWLGVALIIDGVDGSLARYARSAEILPHWSGDVLDYVVDFTTYVFIPAYAIAQAGLLPPRLALPLGLVIVVTGALYCADRRMKTDDHFFRGFPVLWNLVAFHLFLLRPAPWLSAGVVVMLAVLTFVPLPFVHPFRVKTLRWLTVTLLVLWAVFAAIALGHELAPPPWITAILVGIALYFLAAGLLFRRAREATG
jgi:phosphatidylcholine synthase